MQYDFTTVVSRVNKGSGKWNEMCAMYPDPEPYHIPLSVADMELKNAPEIVEGIKEFAENSILGYTGPTDSYFEAVISWMERRHGFTPKKEWIIQTEGVVPALKYVVGAFCQEGDGVLINTPVYYPFKMVVEKNNCTLYENPLVPNGNSYDIDWADFEAKCALPEVKFYILCSPHNPVGRIWTKEELERMAEICLKNNVYILSDEIHNDLILPGYKHFSMGALEEKYLKNCCICTAPSKTFNLAGMQTSNIIIPDEEKCEVLRKIKGHNTLNIFGYEACRVAYEKAEPWLDELLKVLDVNKHLVEDFFAEKIPAVKVTELQGTYLMWLDFRWLNMSNEDLQKFMREKAGWFTDEGFIFGTGGDGFERINIACPTEALRYMLNRLYDAMAAEKLI